MITVELRSHVSSSHPWRKPIAHPVFVAFQGDKTLGYGHELDEVQDLFAPNAQWRHEGGQWWTLP